MDNEPSEVTPTSTSAGYRFTMRVRVLRHVGALSKLTQAIVDSGGTIGAIDILQPGKDSTVREFTVDAAGERHQSGIVEAARAIPGIEVIAVSDRTFQVHEGGKLEITSKRPLKTRDDLSMAYTPGVARVSSALAQDRSRAYDLTIKGNTVAVVSDGSAVLGLGNIGPEGALPVMEGKAILFKEFGGVDAFPICLTTQNVDEIVETVARISPVFGAINLEDISAPRCFEVEDRLRQMLDIPVFHDDQHGTACVVVSGLINAVKLVGKRMEDLTVIVSGVGAAGVATSKLLMELGVRNVIGCDRTGAIYQGRTENMNSIKEWYAKNTNPDKRRGTLSEMMVGADVFVGVSAPGVVNAADMKAMARDAIVFAMANPVPEIMPEEALPYVAVMATGRSDYPNQVNNVLAFPGIFRGALDVRARSINLEMNMAAARAIASLVTEDELSAEYIIPSVLDRRVAPAVAEAVAEAARKSGVARR